jgi:hypothetical protein
MMRCWALLRQHPRVLHLGGVSEMPDQHFEGGLWLKLATTTLNVREAAKGPLSGTAGSDRIRRPL